MCPREASRRRPIGAHTCLPNSSSAPAWEESGARAAVGLTTTIDGGGCPGAGLLMPTEDAQAKTSRTGSKRTTRPTSRSAPALRTSSPA